MTTSDRPPCQRLPRRVGWALALVVLPAIAALWPAEARSQEPAQEPAHADGLDADGRVPEGSEPPEGREQPQGRGAVVIQRAGPGGVPVGVQVRVQAVGEGPAAVVVQEGVVADVMIVEGPAAAVVEDGGDAPAAEPMDAAAMLQQQVAAQAMQYEAILQRVLVQKLALARTLRGDLSPESRRRIRVAGEDSVKRAAQEIAAGMFRQQQVIVQHEPEAENIAEAVGNAVVRLFGLEPARPAAPPPPPAAVDPEVIVGEAVAAALEAEAGAEVGRAFRDELAARQARQRRLSAGRVLRMLDGELHLSAPQRAAIRETLEGNWSEDLLIMEEMGAWTIDGRPVYPGLDRALILPHLNEIQRRRLGEADESQRETVRLNVEQWRSTQLINRLMRRGHEEVEHDAWWAE